MSPKYIVITPARNEEETIGKTVQSMVAQTLKPLLWIIVDDGSTDSTGRILDEVAVDHEWIRVIHRKDRGYRKQGGGVVDAFYDGYDSIGDLEWDFLVKFDADLSFSADYFQQCLAQFVLDPKLGIGGGVISFEISGQLTAEAPGDPSFHVRGATKIYRRDCWYAINGLVRAPGWDTIDELKANSCGWKTTTFKTIPIQHHRFTGAVDGTWKNYVKFGVANYISAYHPLFLLAKCGMRILKRPIIVGSIGILWGYCVSWLKNTEQIQDDELKRYIRDQQLRKLMFRPSIW